MHRHRCLAVAALVWTGCAQLAGIDDFDHGSSGGSGTSAGGGTGAAGGGGTGATGGSTGGGGTGAGGTGGLPTCDGVDTDTDPANCGACGVDCAGGTCTSGVCSPVSLDLGVAATFVARVDGSVLVARGGASPQIVSVPEEFVGPSDVVEIGAVADAFGAITAGPDRVYYSAQTVADLHTCTANDCTTSTVVLPNGAHFNSMVVHDSVLYLQASKQDGKLYQSALTGGVPAPPSAVLDVNYLAEGTEGPHMLGLVPDGQDATFYLNTWGVAGCVYRFALSELAAINGTDLPCFVGAAQGVPATYGLFANASFVLVDTGGGVRRVDPGGNTVSFGPEEAKSPMTADDTYAYLSNGDAGMLVVDAAGVPQAIMGSGPVAGIDATHDELVFFTMGTSLYRWRKLAP